MIERRELTQVTANAELADRLLATARQHLASARMLAASDPYLAYAAVYDAIRKSLSALLQVQGLRATTTGGHLAIMHAVQAQFGTSMGAILRRQGTSAPVPVYRMSRGPRFKFGHLGHRPRRRRILRFPGCGRGQGPPVRTSR